jgi:hypothetical protein
MAERKVIRVIVALADNRHQGIVPVPAKIGNGDDADNNLYWGCSDGLKSYFNRSRKWRRVSSRTYERGDVLERRIYQHIRTGAVLLADAARKDAIILCCKSKTYFAPLLRPVRARPLLLTSQLMYPGSFLLHDALEVYLSGGKPDALRDAVARAYARNQRISVRAARGVFATG